MGAEIDRLEVKVEASASQANKQLDLLISKLNKVASSLSGIKVDNLNGFTNTANKAGNSAKNSAQKVKGFSNSLSTLLITTGKSSFGIKKFTSALGGFVSKTMSANNRSKSLAQSFGMFYATFYPIVRGVKMLGKAINSSMDYIETFNYFNVTMDKIGKEFSGQYKKYGYDSAESYADSFSGRLNELTQKMSGYKVGDDGMLSASSGMSLGLDPQKIMNYQASVGAITNAVGLAGETSANTSKALSMLAADMSSFKNVDLSTVMTNFQSGLIGQSRALYKYGIDITNATLQTYAYKYGLSMAVSEMTQADKMQLRLLAILDQSRVAWGDQANTINSVANQYRILKQQVSNVARTIGNLLIPIAQAVLPVINGIMMALGRLFNFIGPLIYGAERWKKIMDGISGGWSDTPDDSMSGLIDDTGGMMDAADNVSDSTDGIGDSIDAADKKAKKLQRTLLGFDQINKLNDNSDDTSTAGSSGIGSGGIGGLGSGGIDLSDAIANALADYESVWNKAFEDSLNKAKEYADKICAVFNKMWDMIKSGDFEGLGAYIASGVNYIFDKIHSVFNWNKLGPTITSFVDGLTRSINSLVSNVNWQNIGKTFGDGLNVITNTMYLWYSGIDWVNIGTAIANGLNGVINSIDWLMLGKTIGAWIMKIPKILYGFVTKLNWSEVGAGIGTALNGVLLEFDGKMVADGINGLINGILTAIKSFIKTVDWGSVAKAVGDVLGNLDWGTLAKVGLAIATVKLVTGFGSILTVALTETLTKMLGSGIENGLKGIGKKIGGIFTAAGTDGAAIGGIKALGVKISGALGSVFGGITLPVAGIMAGIAALAAAFVDLWNTSETFRDNITAAFDVVKNAVSSAIENIKDSFSGVMEKLSGLWQSICDLGNALYSLYEESGLKDVVALIGELAAGLASIVGSALVETLGAAFGVLGDILGGIIDVLKGVFDIITGIFTLDGDKILEGFTTIGTGIVDMFVNLGQTLADWVSGVWTGIWDNVGGLFESAWTGISDWWNSTAVPWLEGIPQWFSELPGRIGEFLGELLGNVVKWISEMASTVAEEVPKIIDSIVNFFKELPGKIWNGIIAAKDKIVEWCSNLFDTVTTEVPKIVDKVIEFFKELPGKIYDIGKDLITGFIKGIKDFVSGAFDTVKDFCGGVVKGFKNALDIHSPSKVTEGMGENVVAGLRKGIDGTADTASKSMENLANNLKKALDNTLGTMETSTDRSIDSIGKKFDAAEQSAGSAANRIVSAFRNMHIPLPHIYTESWDTHQVGDTTFSTPNFKVNWYAKGGFPRDGELFMANEKGPEMIGKMGNKNVVANNNQITDGIRSAVVDGMMEAMMAVNSGQSENVPYVLNAILRTENNEVLARAVERGNLSRDLRFSPAGA